MQPEPPIMALVACCSFAKCFGHRCKIKNADETKVIKNVDKKMLITLFHTLSYFIIIIVDSVYVVLFAFYCCAIAILCHIYYIHIYVYLETRSRATVGSYKGNVGKI